MSKPQDSAAFHRKFRDFIQYIIKKEEKAPKTGGKCGQNRLISEKTAAHPPLAKVSCKGRIRNVILVKKPEKKEN